MNFQELQPEKLENTPLFTQVEVDKFSSNENQAVVFHDPITCRMVAFMGSASMTMSMEEYAKLRVPKDIPYNIISMTSAANEAIPELVRQEYTDRSLNMFYKYLNAL